MPISYILLVDDDQDDREILESALLEVSSICVCRTARDGAIAFRVIEENENLPDLIFVDLNMPIMGGFEFIKRFKAIEKYSEIPVIVYTTSSLQTDIDTSLKLGASHFITKQKTFSALCSILNKTFNEVLQVTYEH